MRYGHSFQRVLPIMGCLAALTSSAGGTNGRAYLGMATVVEALL
jgi:hypothetical protein